MWLYFLFLHSCNQHWLDNFGITKTAKRTLTVGGSITVQLVSSFTSFDSTGSLHWKNLFSLSDKSSLVQPEASCTVILSQHWVSSERTHFYIKTYFELWIFKLNSSTENKLLLPLQATVWYFPLWVFSVLCHQPKTHTLKSTLTSYVPNGQKTYDVSLPKVMQDRSIQCKTKFKVLTLIFPAYPLLDALC